MEAEHSGIIRSLQRPTLRITAEKYTCLIKADWLDHFTELTEEGSGSSGLDTAGNGKL